MDKIEKLIEVIKGLKREEKVEITKKWCKNHGLNIDSNEAKQLGKIIKKNYKKYDLILDKKTSNNLNHYIKK